MPKEKFISFRIDDDFNNLIENLCNIFKKNKTDIMKQALIEFAENNKDKIDGISKEVIREHSLELQSDITKKENRCFYLIKNMMSTIFNTQSSYLFSNGNVNMEVAEKMIKSYEKIYNTFPEDIKIALKPNFDELLKLGNKEYLFNKLKSIYHMKMIDKKEKRLGHK